MLLKGFFLEITGSDTVQGVKSPVLVPGLLHSTSPGSLTWSLVAWVCESHRFLKGSLWPQLQETVSEHYAWACISEGMVRPRKTVFPSKEKKNGMTWEGTYNNRLGTRVLAQSQAPAASSHPLLWIVRRLAA